MVATEVDDCSFGENWELGVAFIPVSEVSGSIQRVCNIKVHGYVLLYT